MISCSAITVIALGCIPESAEGKDQDTGFQSSHPDLLYVITYIDLGNTAIGRPGESFERKMAELKQGESTPTMQVFTAKLLALQSCV